MKKPYDLSKRTFQAIFPGRHGLAGEKVEAEITDIITDAVASKPELIDAPEAAQIMGITLQAFQQRVQRGKIPRNAIVRTGRRVQFVRSRLPGVTSK